MVANRTAGLLARAPWRRMDRGLAVVTPLPPSQTGIATYSARLLEAMSAHRAIRVYADGREGAGADDVCPGVRCYPIGALRRHREPARLYCFGNSPFHVGALRSLAALGGDVLLHEVALWGLYIGADRLGWLGPGGIDERVRALEGLTLEETIPLRCSMVAEIVGAARRILVHTDQARRDLLERHPDRAADVRVVTFGLPAPSARPSGDEVVVASFGHQRAAEAVVEAFETIAAAVPAARLWLVGEEFEPGQMAPLLARLRAAGLGDRVLATGWLDDDAYRARIAASTVALQPRLRSYGERSAALGDLLAAGVPTVTHDVGGLDGIPPPALARVGGGSGPAELAEATIALLRDAGRRAEMREAARGHAAAHGIDHAAREVLEALEA